jgi:hypothetical protein
MECFGYLESSCRKEMSVVPYDHDCFHNQTIFKGGPPTMKTVAKKRGQGKDIFCAIDLHHQMMLAGIAVDKGEVSFHEFDTMEAGGMTKLVGLLQRVQRSHPRAAVFG